MFRGVLLREERKSFFQYLPGLLGNRRDGSERKSRAQVGSSYLRPGMVSVSDALVLGVLTLDCSVRVKSRKRKGVNPSNSDTGYGVLLHHEFENWKSRRRKHESTKSVRGNRNSRSERESGCTYVCGMSGVQNTRRRTGKGVLLYIRSVFGRLSTNPHRPGDPVAGTCGSGGRSGNRKNGSGTSR